MVTSLDSGVVAEKTRKTEQLELTEQSKGGGRAAQRENPKDQQRVSFKYSAGYLKGKVCEETSCMEKNYTKELEERVLVYSSRVRNSPCSHKVDWKTSRFMGY